MNWLSRQAVFTFVALACLSPLGCSDTNNEKPTENDRAELNEPAKARVLLEDGVYPVVQTGEPLPKGDSEIKIVDLVNVPIEGSEDSTPDKIRVFDRPLLRFRKLSKFDFTFAENECTEIGFENTDELKAYTRNHVGSQLAVVIDNKVISSHKIREPIESAEVRITCCTVGGGDHLHKHLKGLKLAADSNSKPKTDH